MNIHDVDNNTKKGTPFKNLALIIVAAGVYVTDINNHLNFYDKTSTF